MKERGLKEMGLAEFTQFVLLSRRLYPPDDEIFNQIKTLVLMFIPRMTNV